MGNLRVAAMALVVAGAWLMVGHGAALGVDEPEPSPAPVCESDCDPAEPESGTALPATEPVEDGSAEPGSDDSATDATTEPSGTAPSVAPRASGSSPVTGTTAASAQPAPARADAAVAIVDNAYQPSSVTISEGDSVTWTHEGSAPHTVTADDGSFDSGNMSSGDTFSHTFNSAGSFPYFCEVHGQSMSGSVTVEAAGGGGDEAGGGGDDGSTDDASTDETAPADIADQGLPATGRGSGTWAAIGLGLIASGAVTWRAAGRFERVDG